MTMSKSTQAIEPENVKPLVVLKLGGSILYALTSEFYQSLQTLQEKYYVIIVHGGGPEITSMLQKLHIESTFVEGQRKTSESVLQVVEMILKGKVNSYLVNRLNGSAIKAVGLTGYDGGLLSAQLIDEESLGLVGKIETVNHALLTDLLTLGYLPVIAPLAVTSEGVKVNVNADLAAAAIAQHPASRKTGICH